MSMDKLIAYKFLVIKLNPLMFTAKNIALKRKN